MRLPLARLAIGLVGLAAVVYGVANLSAEKTTTVVEPRNLGDGMSSGTITITEIRIDGAALAVGGLALVAFAAWPRRQERTLP